MQCPEANPQAYHQEVQQWWDNLTNKRFNDGKIWYRNQAEHYWFRWSESWQTFNIFQHYPDKQELQDYGPPNPLTRQDELVMQQALLQTKINAETYNWKPPKEATIWETWNYPKTPASSTSQPSKDEMTYTDWQGKIWTPFYKETTWWAWKDEKKQYFETSTSKEWFHPNKPATTPNPTAIAASSSSTALPSSANSTTAPSEPTLKRSRG